VGGLCTSPITGDRITATAVFIDGVFQSGSLIFPNAMGEVSTGQPAGLNDFEVSLDKFGNVTGWDFSFAIGHSTFDFEIHSSPGGDAVSLFQCLTSGCLVPGIEFTSAEWTGSAGQWSPIFPTPVPAALPLFATGLGALGLLGWRRKRKAATA
jgi:hypothetical protein